ncbi:sulfotransferase [Paraburkholderia sp.]|uniref:tetratricopeptide repeat-containing sulfotransferase family protein n=1 Tax=Paraburkholderia sp. TaxID=1926495 RepID=UPI002384C868|nr:sulfotransferase [Paraburkholderia sp.]MDE1184451.1 sulfotransferase [Paraburkholderia sp.]
MNPDRQPDAARDWLAEGQASAAGGRLDDALDCFARAALARPRDASVPAAAAAVLMQQSRFDDAFAHYRAAIALAPSGSRQRALLLHDLGWAFEQTQRLDQAADAYRDAIALDPQLDGSYNNLANCLQALGRFDDAHDAYRRAIALAPDNTLYYRNLVQSKRLSADDPGFIAMEQRVAQADSLSVERQVELHFAFGQALDDAGQPDRSFDHFLKANALHRPRVKYDEAATLGLFDAMPNLVTAPTLAAKRGLGDPSAAPVFVVGMPRSGSTLIEQIIASHPHAFGAGERPEFGAALMHAVTRPDDPLPFGALHDASAAQLRGLGADYLARLQCAVPDVAGHARIVDKYPFNFINVGLIHLALPNARFIHSRRAPVETCLSIFGRLFHDVPFSYDLGELGRYYRAYDALMAHWRRVLPPGVMLEVSYEDLIGDIDGTVRAMLAHCGLDWDARCLDFHRTERPVGTASSAQVRRPLYRTSLTRRRPAAHLLQALYDGLGVQPASGSTCINREQQQ